MLCVCVSGVYVLHYLFQHVLSGFLLSNTLQTYGLDVQTTLEMERRQQEDGYDSDLEREDAARAKAGLPPREGANSVEDAASRAEQEELVEMERLLQVGAGN